MKKITNVLLLSLLLFGCNAKISSSTSSGSVSTSISNISSSSSSSFYIDYNVRKKHNVNVIPAAANVCTMGMMIPALILDRPIDITPLSPDVRATVYGEFAGRPAASGGTVKDYAELGDGNIYIKGIIHADTLYATDDEKRQIEKAFAKGVYV